MRAYVPSLPPASFDVAFMDAYDGAGRVPAHLATGAFLAALSDARPRWRLRVQLLERRRGGGATLKSSARAADELDAAAEEEEAAAGGGATRKEDDEDTRKEDPSAARAYDAFVEAFPRGTVVRVVEVFGQESNVVVVAAPPCAAPPPRWLRAGGDPQAAARLGEALARAKRRLLRGEGGGDASGAVRRGQAEGHPPEGMTASDARPARIRIRKYRWTTLRHESRLS